jgi:hypothetical protein
MTIENEIFIPDDLSVARPLLIALHGGGRDSQSQLDLWKPLAAKEQIILFKRLGSLRRTGSFWLTK